jgi:hypothetical protein
LRPHAGDFGGRPPSPLRNNLAACRIGRNVEAGSDALAITMTKKLLFVTVILLAVTLVAFAADVTGKWTYEMQGRDGTPRPVTITLKQEGTTLTGSVPGMGRRGGAEAPPPTEITNGKVEGDKVSFEVKREFGGNTMVTKYEGTVSGDTMKLKITRDTPNGPMENEVTAKKSTT